MNRLDKTLLITVLLLGGILWLQHRWTIRLTEERDRFRMNSTALLSDVKRMRTDSATMALDAKALRLTIDEYEEFRAEDAETIRRLGVKIRNLEAAARHEVEVIEENRLKGDIKIPVTLNQAVWVEYKGWWFWKRVKAIRQTISSNNPYVEIRYSEYIKIDKK